MSKVEEALDRILTSNDGNNKIGSTTPGFIAASTWEGQKPGYYFSRGEQGLGYYFDTYQQDENQKSSKKKKVTIDEDNNEMKIVLEELERQTGGAAVVELSAKGIRAASKSLESIYEKNATKREEFSDQPEQYMDSELALYEQLTGLQALAADTRLYKHVENSNLMGILTQLLAHDNTDICASVISLFLEWIDPSLIEDDPDVLPILRRFSRIITDTSDVIVSNLMRFQEDEGPQDATLNGIDNTLNLMENILEIDSLTAPEGVLEDESRSVAGQLATDTKIVSWLFMQLESEEAGETLKNRCMEILTLFSQEDVFTYLSKWASLPRLEAWTKKNSEPLKKRKKDSTIDGIEILLQSIGQYRKKQPESEQETEKLENACIVISSCISFSADNLSAFLDGQGVELVVRCLKEKLHAGGCSLKLLDFFGDAKIFKRGAERVVSAGGLKFLFPIFLGSRVPRPVPQAMTTAKAKKEWLQGIKDQVIRIFYCLTFQLDEHSPEQAQIRFLSKFAEDEQKHCDRLVELLLEYDERSRKAEYNFYRAGIEDSLGEEQSTLAAFDAKLQGGGDILHRLAVIAAFVCVNSKRCHERILSHLKLQQTGISLIKDAMSEFNTFLKQDGRQSRQVSKLLEMI